MRIYKPDNQVRENNRETEIGWYATESSSNRHLQRDKYIQCLL